MRKPRPADPSRAPRRRGGRLPPGARREAILRAALPLFARRGWLGTGTRELAAAAGVTEPILYRHFPDKEGLFLGVLEQAASALRATLAEHLDASAPRAQERLPALATAFGHLLDTRLDELRVLSAAGAALESPAVAAAARGHLEALGGLLAQALAAAGLPPGVDGRAAGGLLLEVGLGAALLWPLGVPLVLGPGFRERVVALLVRALAP